MTKRKKENNTLTTSMPGRERWMVSFVREQQETCIIWKKNLNASRPSEDPTQGGGDVKTLSRWDRNRLQS